VHEARVGEPHVPAPGNPDAGAIELVLYRVGLEVGELRGLGAVPHRAVRGGYRGIDPEDPGALGAVLERTRVELVGDRVLVDGRDVSGEIRTPEISRLTSELTALAPVREKMTPLQRELAVGGGVILEGRDTGTVVWPRAEVKFYLDADLETRARRRQRDLAAQGVAMDVAAVAEDVARRDRQDRERALAPLRKPEGAAVVDTSRLSPEEVVERMVKVVEQARCCTG